MCSNQLGTFDYAGIADHTIPFVVYYDISGGVPATSVNYFSFTNKTAGCAGTSAETTAWSLTELNVLTGTPAVLGNVSLSSTTTITTQIQGIPNPTTSPYRFKLTLTSNGVPFDQQFIIYVTRPVDVSLVLDISGSMGIEADPSMPGVTRLDVLKSATGKFLDYFKLFSLSTSGVNIPDRTAVVYFTGSTSTFPSSGGLVDSNIDCSDPMIICVDNIKTDINGKTPQNSTGMGLGVIAGIKQLTDATRKRNVILFTDGMQNSPLPTITGIGSTDVHFDAGAAAGAYLTGLPAGTNITTVSTYSDIKISTIGLAGSGSFFTNLNNIAQTTHGYFNGIPITKVSQLDNAFLFNLTQVLRGTSPQIIDIIEGKLVSGKASEEFTVNKNVSSLVFDLSVSQREQLGFTIDKDGQDVTSFGQITAGNGYRTFAIRFPRKLSDSTWLQSDGKWTIKINGQETEPYKVTLLADDHALKYEGKILTSGKIGDTLSLNFQLAHHLSPITNATVSALILKPGQDLGTLLATSQATKGKDITGQADISSGNIKLQALLQNPEIYQSLIPKEQVITLTSNNDGTYSGIFTNTDVTGPYQVLFRVESNSPVTGKYIRIEMQSTALELEDISYADSQPVKVFSKDTLKLTIRPRAASGLYLGPDYGDRIKLTINNLPITTYIDNVDGSYTYVIPGLSANDNPDITLTVMDEKVFEGKLDTYGTTTHFPMWIWGLIIFLIIVLIYFIWKAVK